MTTLTAEGNIVDRTRLARRRAEALLESLLEAKAASESRLAESRRADHLKQVTGKSSLENAIESTRRMIAMLDRSLAEAQRDNARGNGFSLNPEVVIAPRRQQVG